jgi:GAF domain-containing protein
MIDSAKLADIFVEVADTLVDDFDLADFLHGTAMSAAEVTGSGAVGIMLADHEGLRPMASSNEDARLLELFQVQHAEGPCLDCHRAGEEVADVDIAGSADRWPVFARRAAELGFTTAHCFPLRLREHVIGAMNIFRTDHRFLSDEERRVGRALADLATIGLMQERALRRAEELTEQLQYALNSRIVIEQAKGAIAQTHGISVDQAFELMRGYSRRNRQRLSEVAQALVDDPASIRGLGG